jgi:hypothetical protein
MNKKFLFGMIALLSVSLFFLGCPTEADDDPPAAPSTDASLNTLKGNTITVGSQAGTTAAPKTGMGTVPDGTTSVVASDFGAAAGATVKLYTTSSFDIEASDAVSLTQNDDTPVYVGVTAEDGTTKLYYTITVTEPKTIINDSDLNEIMAYETPPNGTEVTNGSASPGNTDIIASMNVALAEGSKDQGTADVFDAGDTQAITITLTAAAGYTFTGTDITAVDAVRSVLDAEVFPDVALSAQAIITNNGDTLVVTATYTEPPAE